MRTDMLDAALDYAGRGLSIIPVGQDKRPLIKWAEFQSRIASREEITRWWTRHPHANVGIVTGTISGILVIDCDTPEGFEAVRKMLPDALILPIARTPRGGWHLWFVYPAGSGITVGTGFIPGVDFRGEGGYIIAPPSVNGNGKAYTWEEGKSIGDVPLAPLPDILIKKLSLYRGDNTDRRQTATNGDKYFHQGRRDEDLFTVANSLIKNRCAPDFSEYVLNILAKNSNPPFPENEIRGKIDSALKRAARRERSLKTEFREWANLQDGYWNLTDACKTLQVLTREERNHFYVIAHRLKTDGIIEKHGSKSGEYRTVQANVEPVDFLNAPTEEFPITWPLGIDDLAVIYPGNIIVVAGSKSAGKTAFLLNAVRLNQDRHEVVYLNSEMGDTEFRKRLELFGAPLSSWTFKPYHRASDFADLITPEKKIFIVDFLEVTTDFWKVGGMIQEIHKKLKEGVCIIALQKADGRDAGRGGDFSKEKARLYLALDYLSDKKVNQVRIVDAKAWRTEINPRGMYRDYKLVKGSKFYPASNWEG